MKNIESVLNQFLYRNSDNYEQNYVFRDNNDYNILINEGQQIVLIALA